MATMLGGGFGGGFGNGYGNSFGHGGGYGGYGGYGGMFLKCFERKIDLFFLEVELFVGPH